MLEPDIKYARKKRVCDDPPRLPIRTAEKDQEIVALRNETAPLRNETATLRSQLEHSLDYVQRLKHWRFGHRTGRIDDPGQQVVEAILAGIASDHASDVSAEADEDQPLPAPAQPLA